MTTSSKVKYLVYRQDPPTTKRKVGPDGSAIIDCYANFSHLGYVFAHGSNEAFIKAKAHFNILHPVLEKTNDVNPI